MQKTAFYSYKNGELADGCKLCVQGRKLVLFVTGVCTRACYFCPLSEQKFHHDVVYANERPIEELKEIVEEARISGAQGCGITGGDPLAKFERTLEVIRMLKKEFENFHIHLYTPLELVSEEKIKALEEAGLDEIRFHMDLDDSSLWNKVKIKTSMIKGIEIPCIPGKDVRAVIQYARDYVSFFNLNELEYADAKQNKLEEYGFKTKNDYSYGIAGSEELALEMLEQFPDVRIHYCTAKLKDSVQFMNRLHIRALHVKRPFDIVRGPSLIRGAIYGKEDVEIMFDTLRHLFYVEVDPLKKRLLCSKKDLRKFVKEIKSFGYTPVVVEELASYDQFEIESQEL